MLAKPLGALLVALDGLGALAIAGVLFYRAWKADFEHLIRPKELGQQGKGLLVTLGRVGYAALGVVFVEISIFLMVAAFHHNPGEARGLGGALQAMEQQPLGRLLLAVVALGLIAYGVFSVASALTTPPCRSGAYRSAIRLSTGLISTMGVPSMASMRATFNRCASTSSTDT